MIERKGMPLSPEEMSGFRSSGTLAKEGPDGALTAHRKIPEECLESVVKDEAESVLRQGAIPTLTGSEVRHEVDGALQRLRGRERAGVELVLPLGERTGALPGLLGVVDLGGEGPAHGGGVLRVELAMLGHGKVFLSGVLKVYSSRVPLRLTVARAVLLQALAISQPRTVQD